MDRPYPIDVLVIDDSAVVRQVMRELLEKDGDIRVTTAADPLIALGKLERSRPDVIVLDIEMPRMDGITFLKRLRETQRIPVVICSGHIQDDSERALEALRLGATEIVAKPRIGIQQFLQESRVLIADAVRAASQTQRRRPSVPRVQRAHPSLVHAVPAPDLPRRRGAAVAGRADSSVPSVSGAAPLPAARSRVSEPVPRPAPEGAAGGSSSSSIDVVALGASTGGPQALEAIFREMSPTCPGLVAVQHMPEGFTRAFAKRLDSVCPIAVKEAEDGDAVLPGRALIAPGNHHMLVHRQGRELFVEVTSGPLVSRHRPSVNVLFRSVAMAAGARALGVLLTGMGDDGADGLFEMRRAGGYTMAQDQESSAVFGMPRSAIECGAAVEVVRLDELPAKITSLARRASIRLARASDWT
jgi:two-component system chemotaxis response regulator CheB